MLLKLSPFRGKLGEAEGSKPQVPHLLAPLGWHRCAHFSPTSSCSAAAATSAFLEAGEALHYDSLALQKPSEFSGTLLTVLVFFIGKPEVLLKALQRSQKAFGAPRSVTQSSEAEVSIPHGGRVLHGRVAYCGPVPRGGTGVRSATVTIQLAFQNLEFQII